MSHDLSQNSTGNVHPTQANSAASTQTPHNKWNKISDSEPTEAGTSSSETLEKTIENLETSETEASPQFLLQQIESLKRDLQTAQAELKYKAADLQNAHRTATLDLQNARLYAGETAIKAFFPLLDSYEESLKQSSTLEQLQEGVKHILTLMTRIFEKLGVQVIQPASGEVFNPHLHTAMLTEAAATEQAPNTIIRVLQKGYQLHDRVIRPASVVVSKTEE